MKWITLALMAVTAAACTPAKESDYNRLDWNERPFKYSNAYCRHSAMKSGNTMIITGTGLGTDPMVQTQQNVQMLNNMADEHLSFKHCMVMLGWEKRVDK